MKRLMVRVLARDETDLEEFFEHLKELYLEVVCTGVYPQHSEPFGKGLRAFYTLLKEDAP